MNRQNHADPSDQSPSEEATAAESASQDLFEGMTAISAVLDPDIRPFNDRRVLTVFVDKTRMVKKARELSFLRRRAEEAGFTVQPVLPEELDRMTSGNTHGGIVALCSDRTLPDLAENMAALRPDGFYVLLDGIEDPYNFGYTVRSLYAAGADGVILPPRNWMGVAGLVARSSAGTSEKMPLFICDPARTVELFHGAGYRVACAGIRDAVDLYEADLHLPLLLVIGGEKRGISRSVLSGTDLTVRIGYSQENRFRGSLSSAASAAVLGFEVMRQNRSRS
jgi:23S rRNA (guanosine2251-2'-O)-methyltransferase